MYLLPPPSIGDDALWDLCAKQNHEVMSLQDYGPPDGEEDCSEGLSIDFIAEWGFTPCWEHEELFSKFWRYYLDLHNY